MTGGHSNSVKARSSNAKGRRSMKGKKYTKQQQSKLKKKMGPNQELGPFYRATTLVIQFDATTIKWQPATSNPQTFKKFKPNF
jgi:hypothetical protein